MMLDTFVSTPKSYCQIGFKDNRTAGGSLRHTNDEKWSWTPLDYRDIGMLSV